MELIKIESKNGIDTVNARELWNKLGVKKDFSDWIKNRLDGFSEGLDFSTIQGKSTGGRPSSEYYLTLDTAKHICMLERNEKGRQIRQYFIEVEKHMFEPVRETPEMLVARALITANAIITELKPKADFFDAVAGSKDAVEMKNVAKVLNLGMGRNRLFAFLRDRGVLMMDNTPYQKYIDLEYFRMIEQSYSTPDGETHISLKTLVYQKGVDFIRKLIAREESAYNPVLN